MYEWPSPVRFTFYVFRHFIYDSPFPWTRSPFSERFIFSFMIVLFMYDSPFHVWSTFHVWLTFSCMIDFSCMIHLFMYDSPCHVRLKPFHQEIWLQKKDALTWKFREQDSPFMIRFTFSRMIHLYHVRFIFLNHSMYDSPFPVWFTFNDVFRHFMYDSPFLVRFTWKGESLIHLFLKTIHLFIYGDSPFHMIHLIHVWFTFCMNVTHTFKILNHSGICEFMYGWTI